MSDGGGKFTALSAELHDYIVAHGSREDGALARVRESTAALGDLAVMQVSPDQGALLTMLARLVGATRAIELGTFTGYSAICIARGLTAGGTLLACELDPERAETARPTSPKRASRTGSRSASVRRRRHWTGSSRPRDPTPPASTPRPSTSPSSTPTSPATRATTRAASSSSARAV